MWPNTLSYVLYIHSVTQHSVGRFVYSQCDPTLSDVSYTHNAKLCIEVVFRVLLQWVEWRVVVDCWLECRVVVVAQYVHEVQVPELQSAMFLGSCCVETEQPGLQPRKYAGILTWIPQRDSSPLWRNKKYSYLFFWVLFSLYPKGKNNNTGNVRMT